MLDVATPQAADGKGRGGYDGGMKWIAMVMLLLAGFTHGGCQQALFPANTPRSQFERYQYQREGFTPEQREAVFGRGDEIDLKARLKPLGER